MLMLTRKIGESIVIFPSGDLDSSMTVKDLFIKGPITVTVCSSSHQVRLGIDAPSSLRILRNELVRLSPSRIGSVRCALDTGDQSISANTLSSHSDINKPVDRKKADKVARRVARAGRTKAITAWHEGKYRDFFYSVEQLADFAYDYAYKSALRKAIAKQITPPVGRQIKLAAVRNI